MAPIWDLDPIAFYLPFVHWPVRYYGIIFGLIIILGFILFRWQILRAKGTEDEAFGMIVPGALGAVLGARLGHVLFYDFDAFTQNPLWFFRIWEGGLASHGAVLGLILAVLYYSRRYKRPFFEVGDRLSFSFAIAAFLIRLANFLNSEIVGKITDSSWGIRFPRYDYQAAAISLTEVPARYPSQLVESGLGLLVFFILLITDKVSGKEKRPRGLLSAVFLITYFTGRFLVEFLKERQSLADNFIISMGQILSLPCLVFGLVLLFFVFKGAAKNS